mmetsp:Transcript_58083/g.101661  ORF Transcript_58083/g.101661 Transcript_58083/m.101661 type:complete len:342 (+) Transcript_58083:101-1126(+)
MDTANSYTLYSFMLLMLLMGTVNMVMLKFQHMQAVPMIPGGPAVPFDHPWFQAGLMMVGEFLCLPVYFCTRRPSDVKSSERTPKWIFLVPCCCDLIATALVCTGLAFVAVSVVQMCRGSIIIFACAMSFLFLGRRQHNYQLVGVVLVTVGISLVSMSALQAQSKGTSSNLFLGISLCIIAQVFQASMFVYEEKIMTQYVVEPLQVVGMEGLCGIIISGVLLTVFHFLGYANTPGAIYQICHSPPLLFSVFGSMLAVAAFNFSGATVTKKSSAVARTTIKISSTILIWFVELAAGWNTFSRLQLFGFMFVAVGTFVYNRIVVVPLLEPPLEAAALAKAKDDV